MVSIRSFKTVSHSPPPLLQKSILQGTDFFVILSMFCGIFCSYDKNFRVYREFVRKFSKIIEIWPNHFYQDSPTNPKIFKRFQNFHFSYIPASNAIRKKLYSHCLMKFHENRDWIAHCYFIHRTKNCQIFVLWAGKQTVEHPSSLPRLESNISPESAPVSLGCIRLIMKSVRVNPSQPERQNLFGMEVSALKSDWGAL